MTQIESITVFNVETITISEQANKDAKMKWLRIEFGDSRVIVFKTVAAQEYSNIVIKRENQEPQYLDQLDPVV